MGETPTPPTLRSFWVSQFKSTTGLTIDDLYGLNATAQMYQAIIAAKIAAKAILSLSAQLQINMSIAFDTEEDSVSFQDLVSGALVPT